ncbi:MAG: hypothetical protein ACFFDN_13330 [Candidatus Hodarchaeota archaeon]
MSFLESKRFLQISNLVTYFLTIIVNFLANLIPLGGRNTGQVSDNYPDLFAPAGITFSIWSVIYVLLGIFVFYQARDLFKEQEDDIPYVGTISFYYILSNIFNISWLFSWHYNLIPLSLLIMIGILLTLIKIYLNLNIGLEDISTKDKILVHLPFSVYLGWISIATIANTTAFLVATSWDGFGISEQVWTIIVLIIALILTLLMQFFRKDIAYSLVVIWASIGIIIKRLAPISLQILLLNFGVIFEPIYYEIAITAGIAIIIISIGIILIVIQKLK